MPDTQALTPDTPGLWMSVSDLAKRAGVKKQSIAERIARFEANGLVHTRPGPGRTKLVNVAEFDRAAGDTIDLTRAANGGGRTDAESAPELPATSETPSASRSYSLEQARRTSYEAELKRLDLEERLGKLLPIEDVTNAMTRCAEAMVRAIDQLPSKADDLASAVAANGSQGAARALKTIAHDLRETLARELASLESTATPNDEDA